MNSNDIVYHYCSVDAFLNIIQKSELWISDVRKSNDAKEFSWISDKINSKIENKLVEEAQSLNAWKAGFKWNVDNDCYMDQIYTVCFSESSDSLSQWRAYSQDGHGLAIGFSKELLTTLNSFDPYCLKFGKIIYSEDKQEKFVNSVVDEIQKNTKTESAAYMIGAGMSIHNKMRFMFYKNPSFNEEKEWRIVFLTKPGINKICNKIDGFQFLTPKFRASDSKIISYLEMDFSKIKRDIIKEIVIGPKSKVTKADIMDVLAISGYYSIESKQNIDRISITKSASSYQ